MRIWIALIVAPLLALTDQAVAFALVHWACAHQATWVVHLSHVVFLALAAAAAVGAWLRWRKTAISAGGGQATVQFHFLAGVAMMVAALSTLAIMAMWLPTWMISSCIA
jgi:hypothetical protein